MNQPHCGKIIMFSGKVASGNEQIEPVTKSNLDDYELEKQLRRAVYNNDADASSVYLSRAFIILKPETVQSDFVLQCNYDKILYYLGEIAKYKEHYFITPYALWGECVIL